MEADGRYPAMAWVSLGVGICMGILFSRTRIMRSIFPAALDQVVPAESKVAEPFGSASGRFKVVFAARQDLKMGTGKIAAQCGHAAVGIYKAASKKAPSTLKRWEKFGQPKVVLKCPDEDTMFNLETKARALGLLTTIIHDAGHTQVAAGSATVLGIGPGPENVIDSVTGHLKLY